MRLLLIFLDSIIRQPAHLLFVEPDLARGDVNLLQHPALHILPQGRSGDPQHLHRSLGRYELALWGSLAHRPQDVVAHLWSYGFV